jgi:hypothetical protein
MRGKLVLSLSFPMSHRRGARELRGSPTSRLTLDLPAFRVGDGKNGVGVSE